MVQESLIDYIKTQMKLGISRDAIKTTLVGAGWAAADVEDTLKKTDMPGAAPAMMSSQPLQPAQPAGARVITPISASPSVGTTAGPQVIKVSDLISASAPAQPSQPMQPMVAVSSPKSTTPKSPLTGPTTSMSPIAMPTNMAKSPNTFLASSTVSTSHGSRRPMIMWIVAGIVVLGLAGLAGFLYMQNESLTGQLGSLNGQSAGVNSQLAALQSQLTATTTALSGQVSTLTAQEQELQTELSFYAVPPGSTPGVTVSATLSGVVSGGGKTSYVITTEHGAKIFVSNSKSESVIAALAGLVSPTSTSAQGQFGGTYVAGSDSITLSTVNGTAVQ